MNFYFIRFSLFFHVVFCYFLLNAVSVPQTNEEDSKSAKFSVKLPMKSPQIPVCLPELDKKPEFSMKDKIKNMENSIRKLIHEKMNTSFGQPKPLTSELNNIPTTSKDMSLFPTKDCHKTLDNIHHSCPDNCLCFFSKQLQPCEISKKVTSCITKAEPQYIHSIKPMSKLPFLEEELNKLKFVHEQESKELTGKTEAEFVDSAEFGFIPVLRAFIISLSKIIARGQPKKVLQFTIKRC